MAVVMTTQLHETYIDNRWTSEFYNPSYKFNPNGKYEWTRIGRLLKKCQYGLSVQMNESGRGVKIYRLNEIENCFLNSDATKYAPVSDREGNDYSLCINDVLFCRTNGNINYVGRTGILKDPVNAVFASYLVRSQTNSNYLLPEFLTIYLNSKFGRKQIVRRAMFSNQVNVSAAELKKIPIPLIDIQVQQCIADMVNQSFELKSKGNNLYARAEQLLEQELGLDKIKFKNPISHEATFSEVTDFFRIDGEFFRPRYKQLRKAIKNYKGGWEPLKLNIQNLSPNFSPSKTPNQAFQYIELANINPQIGIANGYKAVLGKEAPSRAKRQVSTGDVIASAVVGSVDKAALISETENGSLASTGFFHFRSSTYSPEYLLILLRSPVVTDQLKQQATGGILSAVPDGNLRHMVIPVLPVSLQQQITDLVQESHSSFRESQSLLEQAKKRVEELIEQGVSG